jgi:hypothetical protein
MKLKLQNKKLGEQTEQAGNRNSKAPEHKNHKTLQQPTPRNNTSKTPTYVSPKAHVNNDREG